jgi:hypothetical protein
VPGKKRDVNLPKALTNLENKIDQIVGTHAHWFDALTLRYPAIYCFGLTALKEVIIAEGAAAG